MSIRVHERTGAVFTRGEVGNEQHVPAYFFSAVFDVDDTSNFEFTHRKYLSANKRVFDKFMSATISIPFSEFVDVRAVIYSESFQRENAIEVPCKGY